MAALVPLLAQARDVGLHLVVARRSGGASRALYEPVIQALRDLAMPGLMLSGSPDEGPLLGNLRPAPQTRPTALGVIEVTFTGRYVVDWGDGVEESFAFEGEPWPDGRISHTYTDVGNYNVVVSIEWVADWRIGTTTGQITNGLASVGRIDGFEVRQLQAVRDR